jgi:hypothetical protein
MPQGPIAVNAVSNAKNKLNITAPTVIKAAPGTIGKLIFNVASTTAPAVHDSATTTGIGLTTQVWAGATATAAQTIVPLDFPCESGIVVVPGTGANVTVSFE